MIEIGARIIASPRRGIRWAWLPAALLAVTAAGAGAADDPVQANQEQLEKLRSRIGTLQKSLDRDRRERDTLSSQLQKAEQRMADLATEADGLRRRINDQNRQLRKTTAERAQAQAALERHRQALARQVRAAYVIGRRGATRLLLNQDGSERLSRVLTYYDYLNRARVNRIGSIDAQVQALAEVTQRLRAETRTLEALRSQHLGTLTVLEAARAERSGMVKALGDRIRNDEGALASLRADEKDLASLLTRLRSALADVPADLGDKPFARQKGKLGWPLQGKLLAGFGNPKAGGRLKWNGLWIAGKEGDPVRSIARGRVAYVGWMHRYGLIVVLEHEGGFYSLYGHNRNVSVGVGDWVQAGDVVASVGVTGGYETSGLYFELRRGTQAIDPRPWLKS